MMRKLRGWVMYLSVSPSWRVESSNQQLPHVLVIVPVPSSAVTVPAMVKNSGRPAVMLEAPTREAMPQVTPVPGAQPWMLGVANVRGNLLPVVDLKQFLEGERTVLHEGQRVLVVRQPGGDVAVTIDEMYGQRSFIDAQGIDSEAVAEGRYAHFVDRAYRMNDQDWGVFSLERLARTPEFRQAAA